MKTVKAITAMLSGRLPRASCARRAVALQVVPWTAAALAAFAATLGLFIWLKTVGPLPGDRWAVLRIRHHNVSAFLEFLGTMFSAIGLAPVAAATIAGLWAFVTARISRRAGFLLIFASAAPVLSSLLKLSLGPVPLDALAYSPSTAASFPSGHVAYATALFGYTAVLACRHERRVACVCSIALVLMMGPVRVLSGTHLPSDVLGGYTIGFGWLALVLAAECGQPA